MLVCKNISLLYGHKKNQNDCMWQRDRWLISLTTHWRHIFRALLLLWQGFYTEMVLSQELHPPLADQFTHWPLFESGQICLLTANLLSLYNILNAHTFSFLFPILVVHFHCPLVYPNTQMRYPVLKSTTNMLSKVYM